MIKALLKGALLLAMLAVGYLFYLQMMQQRQFIEQENVAIERYNEEKYSEAAEVYEELLPKLKADARERVSRQLADCYAALSQNHKLSLQKQAEFARKALQYDEDAEVGRVMRLYIQKNPRP